MALSNYVFGNSAADPFFTEMDRAVNRMINNALGVAPTSAGKAGHTHAPMDIIGEFRGRGALRMFQCVPPNRRVQPMLRACV